jgi:hypothetical protein
VNRFIPRLLWIALSCLPVAVGYPAEAAAAVPPRRSLDLRPPDLQSLHVQNLHQDGTSADVDEAEPIAIVTTPLLPEEKPDTQLPSTGIASLYWAARHPTQAWRVFLPIQLDGEGANRGRAAGRATSETLTKRGEISANRSLTMLAPDTGGNCARRTQSGEAT